MGGVSSRAEAFLTGARVDPFVEMIEAVRLPLPSSQLQQPCLAGGEGALDAPTLPHEAIEEIPHLDLAWEA